MIRRRFLAVLLALLWASPACIAAQEPTSVVYVFRHAERAEDGTDDPPISEEGQARARLVADLLGGVGLTQLHTTDYRRTRSTIEPTAGVTGLRPQLYDAGDLAGFAERLRATRGRHLVVGHSNTNPELVEALGGDPGGPIGTMEYDRAYVVVVLPSGAVGSAIFRFGAPEGQTPRGGGRLP